MPLEPSPSTVDAGEVGKGAHHVKVVDQVYASIEVFNLRPDFVQDQQLQHLRRSSVNNRYCVRNTSRNRTSRAASISCSRVLTLVRRELVAEHLVAADPSAMSLGVPTWSCCPLPELTLLSPLPPLTSSNILHHCLRCPSWKNPPDHPSWGTSSFCMLRSLPPWKGPKMDKYNVNHHQLTWHSLGSSDDIPFSR